MFEEQQSQQSGQPVAPAGNAAVKPAWRQPRDNRVCRQYFRPSRRKLDWVDECSFCF